MKFQPVQDNKQLKSGDEGEGQELVFQKGTIFRRICEKHKLLCQKALIDNLRNHKQISGDTDGK